jgi:hypothetical protein
MIKMQLKAEGLALFDEQAHHLAIFEQDIPESGVMKGCIGQVAVFEATVDKSSLAKVCRHQITINENARFKFFVNGKF